MEKVLTEIFVARNGRKFLREEDFLKHEGYLDESDRIEENKLKAKVKKLEGKKVFNKDHEDIFSIPIMCSINFLAGAIHKNTYWWL